MASQEEVAPIVVSGEGLTIADVVAVARHGTPVVLPDSAEFWNRVRASCRLNGEIAEAGIPIYGVTTGLGEASNRQLGPEKALHLQQSLVDHLGAGMGDILPKPQARAVVLARLSALAKGNSAARPELLQLIVELLNRDVVPCIPEQGSVGASGDLIPSSYLAAVLTGRRKVFYKDAVIDAAEAFAAEGLEPLVLQPKEGLALVNGTAFMTGIGALVVHDAEELARLSDICTALTVEVLKGNKDAFAPFVSETKPHPGQIRSAATILGLLDGSRLARSYDDTLASIGTLSQGTRTLTVRLQDRYSVRCAPQFIGALYDACAWARRIVEVELNSSNDNPLYSAAERRIYNGGNFAGSHIAMAMDTLKNALASTADLLDRQLALIVDAKFSQGLPHNLSPDLPAGDERAGTQHGVKALQLVVSALTAEARNLTKPQLAFSRSTAAHNQDKVSMGATAARRARECVLLLQRIVAAHLMGLCQAADLRGAGELGAGTRAAYQLVRGGCAFVELDRELDTDLQVLEALVQSGALTAALD
ncbi:MAG: HAL/PAL/TAL family ammonia-lyase [Pararhizobium sp.]